VKHKLATRRAKTAAATGEICKPNPT